MIAEDQLKLYTLTPRDRHLDLIRHVLTKEIELEKDGGYREDDVALLSCVQLFSRGRLEDVLLIWEAKTSGFDPGSYLDIKLLCGARLERTKTYLATHPSDEARAALDYIEKCELSGDFEDWSPAKQMEVHRSYFGSLIGNENRDVER